MGLALPLLPVLLNFLESSRKKPLICMKLRAKVSLVQMPFQATKPFLPTELSLGQFSQLALKTKLCTGQEGEQQ